MKKVLMVFRPLNETLEYVRENGDEQYAPHHWWCYDQLIKKGYQVDFIEPTEEHSFWNKLGKKLDILYLEQQLKALKRAKNYDVVYAPFLEHVFLLALMRFLGLFRTPLVAIAQHEYGVNKKNYFKRLKQWWLRLVNFKGTDNIIHYIEAVADECDKYKIKGHVSSAYSWGIDYHFYDDYKNAQLEVPRNDYIFSTGGSKRDFPTLVKAFNELDFKLKITTIGHFDDCPNCVITPNIEIDNSLPFGMSSPGLIRKDYYHALAVGVPLQRSEAFATYGITVVMEAMAMGKPVITTLTEAYPFNVEKEKIGLLVDYGDVEGWRQAVQYLIDHPEEAREMGMRGKHLIRTKYNYDIFSEEVIAQIAGFFPRTTTVKPGGFGLGAENKKKEVHTYSL
ncbi:MAG: glycosyltransferase family 4 protein [Lewinella sp.]|nr:glycosyltransferase family 4 protein [Lewinella sp.]